MSKPFYNPNSFPVTIKERFLLNKSESVPQTFHIVLDSQKKQPSFKVGDSLAVYCENDHSSIEPIIKLLGWKKGELITNPYSNSAESIDNFLIKQVNIGRTTVGLLQLFSDDPFVQSLLKDKKALEEYLLSHDLLDTLQQLYRPTIPIENYLPKFAPMLPRFYSIASSPSKYPDEFHLTVALASTVQKEKVRYGIASRFLTHIAQPNETVIFSYLQPTHHFTLPPKGSEDIIMVAAGTGIAPFRAFLQERSSSEEEGKNWLFFGGRHPIDDFFYQKEWQSLLETGKLKLELAFSRDEQQPSYIQDHLYDRGEEVWEWLSQGAYFYVCGRANPMAKQIEKTVHDICRDYGKLSTLEAIEYVVQLRHAKRYLADVY